MTQTNASAETRTVPVADIHVEEEFNPRGFRVPTGNLPYWLMWMIARFDRTIRLALNFVGRQQLVSADKARHELGWTMRPVRESVLDTGHSLVEHGLAKPRRQRV